MFVFSAFELGILGPRSGNDVTALPFNVERFDLFGGNLAIL